MGTARPRTGGQPVSIAAARNMRLFKWFLACLLGFAPAVALAVVSVFDGLLPFNEWTLHLDNRISSVPAVDDPPLFNEHAMGQAGIYVLTVVGTYGIALMIVAAVHMHVRQVLLPLALAIGISSSTCAVVAAAPWIFARPQGAAAGVTFPPTAFEDQTEFAREVHSVHPGQSWPLECLGGRRRHWLFDEVGLMEADWAGFNRRYTLGWEDYGVPFRSFQIPFRFDEPRGEALVYLKQVVYSLKVLPLQFAGNILVWSVGVVILIRAPGALRWLRRARAGCCVHCGYAIVGELSTCPECGNSVAPIDRFFVGAGHRASSGNP